MGGRTMPSRGRGGPDGDALAVARRLFETTRTPLTVIARQIGVSTFRIRRHIRMEGWRRCRTARPNPDGSGLVCPGLPLCPVRTGLHRRLYGSLLVRIHRAEAVAEEISAAERERDIRVLAAMTRTLDKLMGMDRDAAADALAGGYGAASIDGDGSSEERAPYDVETLRRELSDRLDRLVRSRGGP
jgi:hypothetical protein